VAYPRPVVLVASASYQTEHIAGAGLTASATAPDGTVRGLALKDDGQAPDVLANDGLYSALLPYDRGGVYTVTAAFDNQAGTAVLTEIAEAHALGPNGEAWTPTTTPVSETFTVTASTQVTITGWQPDDHGDSPPAATLLAPDNARVAGRIDRAGDVDVFQVTPEISETLVLRLGSVALGLSPRLRVLAADGTTVLHTFNLPSQGDEYFLTRLPVEAGVPFYVEVTDQNAGAAGGLYEISIGAPLDTFREQATVSLFLPLIRR
jgi:hypothetical protein